MTDTTYTYRLRAVQYNQRLILSQPHRRLYQSDPPALAFRLFVFPVVKVHCLVYTFLRPNRARLRRTFDRALYHLSLTTPKTRQHKIIW